MGIDWLALGYHLPPEPSKNRVYIWRKLRAYGAEYFKQGVAVLPLNDENLERFSKLRARIHEMGGGAMLVTMQFLDPGEEAALLEKFGFPPESPRPRMRGELRQGLSDLLGTARSTMQSFGEQLRGGPSDEEE